MAVWLCEELHATGLVQFLQLGNDLWSVELQLLDARTRQREGDLEILAIVANHVADGVQCRHVAVLGNIADTTLVLIVIVVVVVSTDVEETIALQMDNLVYLEI